MNFKKYDGSLILAIFAAVFAVLGSIFLFYSILNPSNFSYSLNAIENSEDWAGYSPYKIYTIYNKHTGVYYAITETGDICPLYTIEGEVMLVDQGNEYVVHKNLGEPSAQE